MASIYGTTFNLYQQYNNYRLLNTMAVQRVPAVNSIGTSTRTAQSRQNLAKLYSNQAKGALSSDTLSFVKQYQNSMADMMSAAESLRDQSSSSVLRQMSVTSGNTAVAEASASWQPSESASYQLDVKQLAAAQVNRSKGIDLTGAGFSGDLQIQTEKGTFNFRADASASGSREALNGLVRQINEAKTGVVAGLSTVDGKASLTLTAAKTGESGAFAVSGTLAEANGLVDAAQQAQNAVYTVQKSGSALTPRERTSESNTIDVDNAFRITAKLKSTGSTTITAAPDTAQTAKAVQNLVDSFNSSLKLLNDNADRGEGVLRQMKRMIIPPTSEKSMALAGVTINKDGTMHFDSTTFQKAVHENPSLLRDVIGGSFGMANGIYNDARQGLSISSKSLVSQDLKEAQLAAVYNPSNIMGTYTRNGVYNMANFYAANVLMNLMV